MFLESKMFSDMPGEWLVDAMGHRHWQGQRFWTHQHGPAVIELVCDQPVAIMNCRTGDGQRRTVFRLWPTESDPDPQWCYPVAGRPLQCGEIVTSGDDIEFRETAARPNHFSHVSGDRGGWRTGPRGGRIWHGPMHWADAHGPAVMEFEGGEPSTVRGCLFADGSRGTIMRGMRTLKPQGESYEFVEGRWQRPMADGSWADGDISVADDDIRFIEDPPRPRRQLGQRSPDDEPELTADFLASPEIAERVKDAVFATNLYRALCNVAWRRNGRRWSCTWRGAGGIVAELRDLNEDYRAFYCSGGEGTVAPEVEAQLRALGWEEHGFG